MKGKNIVSVGDSLGNNQWESLACLLHAALPSSKYDYQTGDALIPLKFLEYEVSLQYLKNEFLVDLSIEKDGRILKLDSITNTSIWEGAVVLIFNNYYWWTHTGTLQAWDYLEVGSKLIKDMDRMKAYNIGLSTWAKWIDTNIDPNKTSVFFQGIPALHFSLTVPPEWPKRRRRRLDDLQTNAKIYPWRRRIFSNKNRLQIPTTTPVHLSKGGSSFEGSDSDRSNWV
ncbi:hypothetical protein KY289_019486 [Solanum tuberosum]|nr:hypothetical protein KY289_019486 [Solanum tuberosum]